jgi:putative aldouronate transport system substrate-binding protein
MKQGITKWLSVLLVVVMITVMIGCGNNNEETEDQGTTETATESENTETSTEEKQTFETVTLEMFSLPSNASGLQQGWWANVLEEEIGVKLDIIATGDQGEQKYQALLAGGEFPDIVVFRSIKEAEDAVKALG